MPAKILIVEDTLDMRELLHLYLTKEGFSVVTACDGREGLYLARAERPDLIITDLNMPGIDGLSLITELRGEQEFNAIPIIAFTAFGRESRNNAIEAGADRAVNKPTEFEALINGIYELLDERKTR